MIFLLTHTSFCCWRQLLIEHAR